MQCGGGLRRRVRQVRVAGQFGGKECPHLVEEKECNSQPCGTIDGLEWCDLTPWSNFSDCSAKCGGGIRVRDRLLIRRPLNESIECGALQQRSLCNTHPCPEDCEVSAWGPWSPCSSSCSGGIRVRTRRVLSPSRNGGRMCPPLHQWCECNLLPCPKDCRVGKWSDWSACSSWCGDGLWRRERTITQPSEFGGASCPALVEEGVCHLRDCPALCQVGDWTEWTNCTVACGSGGLMARTRKVFKAPSTAELDRLQEIGFLNGLLQRLGSDGRLLPASATGYTTAVTSLVETHSVAVDSDEDDDDIANYDSEEEEESDEPLRPHKSAFDGVESAHRAHRFVAAASTSQQPPNFVVGNVVHISHSPHLTAMVCGEMKQEATCNSQPCPIDCEVGPIDLSHPNNCQCSEECATGQRTVFRRVLRPNSNGGQQCHPLAVTVPCEARTSAVQCKYAPPRVAEPGVALSRVDLDCRVSKWSHWTPCLGGQVVAQPQYRKLVSHVLEVPKRKQKTKVVRPNSSKPTKRKEPVQPKPAVRPRAPPKAKLTPKPTPRKAKRPVISRNVTQNATAEADTVIDIKAEFEAPSPRTKSFDTVHQFTIPDVRIHKEPRRVKLSESVLEVPTVRVDKEPELHIPSVRVNAEPRSKIDIPEVRVNAEPTEAPVHLPHVRVHREAARTSTSNFTAKSTTHRSQSQLLSRGPQATSNLTSKSTTHRSQSRHSRGSQTKRSEARSTRARSTSSQSSTRSSSAPKRYRHQLNARAARRNTKSPSRTKRWVKRRMTELQKWMLRKLRQRLLRVQHAQRRSELRRRGVLHDSKLTNRVRKLQRLVRRLARLQHARKHKKSDTRSTTKNTRVTSNTRTKAQASPKKRHSKPTTTTKSRPSKARKSIKSASNVTNVTSSSNTSANSGPTIIIVNRHHHHYPSKAAPLVIVVDRKHNTTTIAKLQGQGTTSETSTASESASSSEGASSESSEATATSDPESSETSTDSSASVPTKPAPKPAPTPAPTDPTSAPAAAAQKSVVVPLHTLPPTATEVASDSANSDTKNNPTDSNSNSNSNNSNNNADNNSTVPSTAAQSASGAAANKSVTPAPTQAPSSAKQTKPAVVSSPARSCQACFAHQIKCSSFCDSGVSCSASCFLCC